MNQSTKSAPDLNQGNPYKDCASYKDKRSVLCRLSVQARKAIEAIQITNGVKPHVNDVLLKTYQDGQHTAFKTFNGWKKEGKRVKAGSRAFYIWSRPLSELKDKAEVAEDDDRRFGMVCMFSNFQVA